MKIKGKYSQQNNRTQGNKTNGICCWNIRFGLQSIDPWLSKGQSLWDYFKDRGSCPGSFGKLSKDFKQRKQMIRFILLKRSST